LRRSALVFGIAFAAGFAGLLWLLGTGTFGSHWGSRDPVDSPWSPGRLKERAAATSRAAAGVGLSAAKQILFGDLHVHTTFSPDAFMAALPMAGGSGAHPVSDACDFARFCSELDFWSINDHAEGYTPRRWAETVESMRQCDAVAGDPANPDVAVFLGWEWTQMGTTPEDHYGHRNVILRYLEDAKIPDRPLAAATPRGAFVRSVSSPLVAGWRPLLKPGEGWGDLLRFTRETADVAPCPAGVPARELPRGCRASAATPAELFAWLEQWGSEAIVIPHGTTWGIYTPPGSSWDKQLVGPQHDPQRQTLIEVFSGHGNSEEFRAWREVEIEADGTRRCPKPVRDYEPSCWRAGEIVRARCAAEEESQAECQERAEQARQNYVDAPGVYGHVTVPGARVEDWLDAGQCRSCFQPAFNYRPRSAAQYILALRDFGSGEGPRRFQFGFIASSDNHSARPGTGYKEVARTEHGDVRLSAGGSARTRRGRPPEARSRPLRLEEYAGDFARLIETERSASFFGTGGLVAVHANGRSRDAIWQALGRREVYGTSGPRILLWFELINPPGSSGAALPMGGETAMSDAPVFQVRAVGSLEQKPGCPPRAAQELTPEGVERLCRGECYHPSDLRRRITRIEVVRIRPQIYAGEPVESLIDDPWRIFECEDRREGCVYTFTDNEFPSGQRDALYYARAIEEPSRAVNAGLLRCERDAQGNCLHVSPCSGTDPEDDCLAETEERAWSSPIFVQHAGVPVP